MVISDTVIKGTDFNQLAKGRWDPTIIINNQTTTQQSSPNKDSWRRMIDKIREDSSNERGRLKCLTRRPFRARSTTDLMISRVTPTATLTP